jgi:hypothetical protein
MQITTVRSTAQRVRQTSALIDDATAAYAMATIHVAGQCAPRRSVRSSVRSLLTTPPLWRLTHSA